MKNHHSEEHYASPTIELIEVAIEQGFAPSASDDFAPAGELDESDSYDL